MDCNHTNTSNCSTTPRPARRMSRDKDLAQVEIAILGVIFVLCIIGNTTIIAILLRTRRKMTRMLLFLLHLAVADLLTGIFTVLPQMLWKITYHFYGEVVLCKCVKFLQLTGWYSSAFILVATALDRFYAVFWPLRSQAKSTKGAHILVGVSWGLAFVLSIPQAVGFHYNEDRGNCVSVPGMFNMKAYVTAIGFILWVLPSLVLVVTYTIISCTVWRNFTIKDHDRRHTALISKSSFTEMSTRSEHDGLRTHTKNISRSKVRTIILTLVVSVIYIVCWAPYWIATLWLFHASLEQRARGPTDAVLRAVMSICGIMGNINCCVNPFIYLIIIDKFRDQVRYCFRSCINSRCRPLHPGSKLVNSDSTTRSYRMSTYSPKLSKAKQISTTSQEASSHITPPQSPRTCPNETKPFIVFEESSSSTQENELGFLG